MSSALDNCTRDDNTLATRLAHLEQQNGLLAVQVRRLKMVVTGFMAVVSIGLLWVLMPANEAVGQAARTPNVVRANSFVLVDKAGMQRGSLSYNDTDKFAGLTIDTGTDSRISLGIAGESLSLRLTRAKNDINLGISPKAGTYFEMYDKDGKAIFEQRQQ